MILSIRHQAVALTRVKGRKVGHALIMSYINQLQIFINLDERFLRNGRKGSWCMPGGDVGVEVKVVRVAAFSSRGL